MTREELSLAHRHDAVEALAYREMYAGAPRALAAELGLETRETAGATLLIAPGLPAAIFNRVIGLGNGRAVSDADLAAIAAAYRAAGARTWWVHATPGEQFEALRARLEAHGYTTASRRSWAKVWRGAEAAPRVESAAEVRPLRKGEEAQTAEALCAAFELPPRAVPWLAALATRPDWLTAVALVQGAIVGAGMLHLQGEAAWLGIGGVRPDARRARAHRALMALRITEAIGRGCTGLFTETGEPAGDEPNPSLRNMEACGFRKVFSRLNFAAPKAPG